MLRRSFWAIIFALSIGLLAAGGKNQGLGGCSRAEARSFQNTPDFTLPLFNGGQSVALSEVYKQQPVLIVFWASWCPSCVSEVRTLNQWQELYGPRGLKILAIDVQESSEKMERFMQKHAITYPVLMDTSGEVAGRYGVNSLPTSVLLAKGGEILYYGFRLPPDIERIF